MRQETTTLAGGCFWCLEAVYDDLKGIISVDSGYMGGPGANPSYEQVCTGRTGHAEVVQIVYDADVVTFQDLLDVFFTIHDPTTLNRQGADIGTQYRSAVYYHTPEQKAVAEATIAALDEAKVWNNRIVTEVTALQPFYRAEDYHQEYFVKHPNQGYCQAIIAPKVAKFRKQHLARLRA